MHPTLELKRREAAYATAALAVALALLLVVVAPRPLFSAPAVAAVVIVAVYAIAPSGARRRVLALALVVVVVLAAVVPVNAQTTNSSSIGVTLNAGSGNAQVQGALQTIANWVGTVLFALRSLLAIAFWVVIAILVYHAIMAKVMPTRFTRIGALMDAVERAKDVVYAAVGLFILLFAIALIISVATGGGNAASLAWGVFYSLYIQPLAQAFSALAGAH